MIEFKRLHKPKGACIICGKGVSDTQIDINDNEFRGDRTVLKAHALCLLRRMNQQERGSLFDRLYRQLPNLQ